MSKQDQQTYRILGVIIGIWAALGFIKFVVT